MRKWLPIILITLLAGILRFANLDSMPISPNWDEVSHGYNAYSILTTGKDEWGKSFPLIFQAFGDYKLPLYIYLTVIPVALFGLNTFALRFISALAGTIAIPGTIILANALFPKARLSLLNKKIDLGIISGFFLAICPWHFFISRPALEANLALALIIYAAYFLIKGLHDSKSWLASAFLFGLAINTYNTARVFVPLILITFGIIHIKEILISTKKIIAPAVILFILCIPMLIQIGNQEGIARYSKLQILSDNAIFQIGESYQKSTLPKAVAKLLYNKPVYFLSVFVKNYLSYFSPQFIFQSKGAQSQFAIPGEALISISVIILFLVGLFFILKTIYEKPSQFLLAWLLLSPVAASLTADPPQALRPNPMIPAIILIATFGLYKLCSQFSKFSSIIFLATVLTAIYSFYTYTQTYYGSYRAQYSLSWQYGYQEAMQYIEMYGSAYDKVFITKKYGEPHIFYAYFTKLNPAILQPGGESFRFSQSNWFWTDRINNVYFLNDWDISTSETGSFTLESGSIIPNKRSLLITSPDHVPVNSNLLKKIVTPNGQPVFIIVSIP